VGANKVITMEIQVAIREHREPFYPKTGDFNRFTAKTCGTLVEQYCHYFDLKDVSAATGLVVHRSIATGLHVALSDMPSAGY